VPRLTGQVQKGLCFIKLAKSSDRALDTRRFLRSNDLLGRAFNGFKPILDRVVKDSLNSEIPDWLISQVQEAWNIRL
jgi:hypothetical protein